LIYMGLNLLCAYIMGYSTLAFAVYVL
jgi:hypothetical protein